MRGPKRSVEKVSAKLTDEGITLDINYLLYLQHIRTITGGALDDVMLFLTALAQSHATYIFLAFIYWCVDKNAGRFMGFNVALACSLNQLLKPIFNIDRPWVRSTDIHPVEAAIPAATGASFPSGHTTRATATWGTYGYWSIRRENGKKRILGWLLLILAILIAFSRNYLGVHTPQDVIVGFGISALVWILAEKIIPNGSTIAGQGSCELKTNESKKLEEQLPLAKIFKNNSDIICLLIFSLLTIIAFRFYGVLSNFGAGMGFFVSWILDRRLIRFSIPDNLTFRSITFIVGGIGLFLILDNAYRIVAGVLGTYAGFAYSFLIMFYIFVIVPGFVRVLALRTDKNSTS